MRAKAGLPVPILLLILVMPVLGTSNAQPGELNNGRPEVVWTSGPFNSRPGVQYSNTTPPLAAKSGFVSSSLCDTDMDNCTEVFVTYDDCIKIYDPPTYNDVLTISTNYEFYIYNSPLFLDLVGDGSIEIIAFVEAPNGRINITIYSGTDFRLLWKSPGFKHCGSMPCPDILDLDGDGIMEIIWLIDNSTPNGSSTNIYVYNGSDFEVEWIGPSYSESILVEYANIDGDRTLEMLISEYGPNEYLGHVPMRNSLSIFDGASHQLQWKITEGEGVSFDFGCYYSVQQNPSSSTGQTTGRSIPIEDSILWNNSNNGAPDICFIFDDGKTNTSGIWMHNGATGDRIWAATSARSPNIGMYTNRNYILNISDVDGDGFKEIVSTFKKPDSTEGNSTEIRIYQSNTGVIKWNLTVSGYPIGLDVDDINTDRVKELLISTGTAKTHGLQNHSYEIIDLRDYRSMWRMGPELSEGCSILYGEDMNHDGVAEIIISNETYASYYGMGNCSNHYFRTFQVLSPENYNVLWTSPQTISEKRDNSVELLSYDDESPSDVVICTLTWDNDTWNDGIVKLFSSTNYTELWRSDTLQGFFKISAENIANGPRDELVIELTEDIQHPYPPQRGINVRFFILDTLTYSLIWTSPQQQQRQYDYISTYLTSSDINQDSKNELIFINNTDYGDIIHNTSITYHRHDTWISIFTGSIFHLGWTSGPLNNSYSFTAAGDFDNDSKIELLMQYQCRLSWLKIIRFPDLNEFAVGVSKQIPDTTSPIITRLKVGNYTTPAGRLYYLPGVEIADADDDNFSIKWMENGHILNTSNTFYRRFAPGNHSLTLIISDGNLSTTTIINFTAYKENIQPSIKTPFLPGLYAAIVITAATVITMAGLAFASGTEAGKFKLTAFLLPLYTRLRKEEILDNTTRDMIRGCIYTDPGIHYNEIIRRLKLNNGNATHHLMTLEREGFIKSKTDNHLKRYYPAEMNTSKIPPKLNEIQALIFKKIQEKEGIRQGDIAHILEIPYSTVNRQVKKMAMTGILRLERHGLTIKCYVLENIGKDQTN